MSTSVGRPHPPAWAAYGKVILVFCIPTVAALVAARQVYLSRYHDLSTWKGGGMGLFGAADASLNRYTKVFLAEPGGRRQPLTELTPEQNTLINRALNYPVRDNFLLVAKSIAKLDWVGKRQRMPVALVDSTGKNIGAAPESYYMMMPFGIRPRDEKWKWEIRIEYWKLSYDPRTRHAHGTLAKTFVFGPEELQPQ